MTTRDTISFGPYRLIPAQRLLLRGDEVLEVGCRALDILIALVDSAGDVVGQRELMARAWPDVQVGDGSLRVTIAGLRKTLGDGRDGMRYIANVTGRGYCFVAHVDRSAAQPLTSISLPLVSEALPKHKLPTRLARMVGRDDSVETLSMLLVSRRFVSIVGSGGMGKTTVAVAVAHALRDEFGGAVYFVDLGAVTNPALVASAVAAVLGIFGQPPDPLSGLMAFLAGRRLLLVLDNCEHVIEAAASMTDRIHSEAPQVHIIATSRESLRVEGEHVHFLMPLDCPPTKDDLTAVEALATASVQLFMDRAFASGYAFALTDADAPAVATICRRLDGIPLAIELAASRVGAYGLRGTADLLRNRLELLWQGRRSAPLRQQTLAAMVDWSFNLLSARDRRVLIRLSTFVGLFTLDAAQAVAADEQINAMDVADSINSLINKSLIWVVQIDATPHHRLLDSALAFAAEKLAQTAEANAVAERHALYYVECLSRRADAGRPISIKDVAFARPYIGSIRAALEWSFSNVGVLPVGVERTRRDARLDDFDSYYAVFQIAGSSTVIRDDVVSHLHLGDFALVDSARPVTYISECDHARWLSLVLPRQKLITHSGFEPRHFPAQSGITAAGRLLFQLVSNFGEENNLSSLACSCMQLAIFDLIGALTAPCTDQTNGSPHSDKLFARVCDVMRRRFGDPDINPQEVAAEVGISLRYLQKLFTARNSTYSHFLTSLRLDHAAHLLRRRALTRSAQPLSAIAYACGYREYAHFARSFRRHFGRVPRDFQNNHGPGADACAVRAGPERSAY